MNSSLLTSNTPEHYTPPNIIKYVYDFFGEVDLDPCTNSREHPVITASKYYDINDNGLKQPWAGNVFVNPPYGRELPKWVAKCVEEYQFIQAQEILLLVPSRTDTKWTAMLDKWPRCYVKGRIKFINSSGIEQDPAPFPSAIFYLGNRLEDFADTFQSLGSIATIQYPCSGGNGED